MMWVLTTALTLVTALREPRACVPVTEKYGLVCVCNETYCDDVPPLPTPILTSSAVVYTTSKAGANIVIDFSNTKEVCSWRII